MTLQEILKSQNLTDEQIKGITEAMKTNGVFTASEENLDVRYKKLKDDHDALTAEHTKSTGLIAELQKATKGQESIQAKIAEYEATIQKQQEELTQAKTESAVKIALLGAGAKESDIDYLIYKMNHDGDWKAELDDSGKLKGIDEKLKGMKTQFPSQFETGSQKKIDEKKLEKPDNNNQVTKEDFAKMGYKAKVQLRQENPELYDSFTK